MAKRTDTDARAEASHVAERLRASENMPQLLIEIQFSSFSTTCPRTHPLLQSCSDPSLAAVSRTAKWLSVQRYLPHSGEPRELANGNDVALFVLSSGSAPIRSQGKMKLATSLHFIFALLSVVFCTFILTVCFSRKDIRFSQNLNCFSLPLVFQVAAQSPANVPTTTPPLSNATVPTSFLYDSSVSTLGGQLTLNWILPADGDFIHFRLTCKCTGWVALGLGSGMGPATDMMIGRVQSDGSVSVGDYWSTTEKIPDKDKDVGGFDDLFGVSGYQLNGTTSVAWSRKLVTGDKYDQPIEIGNNYIVLAFQPSEWELMDHRENMAVGKINVVRGAPGTGSAAGGFTAPRCALPLFRGRSPWTVLIPFVAATHGFVMVVSWFVVLTTGAFFGRYGKSWPKISAIWFKYHQNLQIAGYISACIGVLIQFFFAPVHFAVRAKQRRLFSSILTGRFSLVSLPRMAGLVSYACGFDPSRLGDAAAASGLRRADKTLLGASSLNWR